MKDEVIQNPSSVPIRKIQWMTDVRRRLIFSSFIPHPSSFRRTQRGDRQKIMAITKDDVVEYLKGMTLLEASELVKELEEVFGVSAAAAAAPMAMAAGAGAGGGEAAP